MTRVLSELLGAREPGFSKSLRQLEIMSGHPAADIRLSNGLQQSLHGKLRELNLDAVDTTGRELYAALGQRLKIDEERFTAALMKGSVTSSTIDQMALLTRALKDQLGSRKCFALKSSLAKKIIKENLPRRTMKMLGYRSADSMLKHESAAALFAAGWLIEPSLWTKKIISRYAKLQANDFETRPISIEHPASARWQKLSETIVATRKYHVLSFTELGAVVLLPLPADTPPLPVLTTAALAVSATNEICAGGTYLKLQQMQSNFGSIVQSVVTGEPMLAADALDEPVSWHSLQQYFARFQASAKTDIFEPFVAAEELVWDSVEEVLTRIEPALEFWKHTAHLGLCDGGAVVSMNLTDALLSHCNHLPFERRVLQHFRKSLRSEILLQYLSHDKLEQVVLGNVRGRLVPEMATI